VLPVLPVVADPLPELLLSAETGALTDPGRVTEISDPPVPELSERLAMA
jgi:hypothetical protein